MRIKKILTMLTAITMVSLTAACGSETENTQQSTTQQSSQETVKESTEEITQNTPETTEQDSTAAAETTESSEEKETETASEAQKESEMAANTEDAGGIADLRDYQLYQLADFANADSLELTYEESQETYTGYDGNLVIAPTPTKDGFMITLSNGMTEVAAYGVTLGMSADEAEEYWTSQGMTEVNQYGNLQFQIDGNENQYLIYYQTEDGTVERIEYTKIIKE